MNKTMKKAGVRVLKSRQVTLKEIQEREVKNNQRVKKRSYYIVTDKPSRSGHSCYELDWNPHANLPTARRVTRGDMNSNYYLPIYGTPKVGQVLLLQPCKSAYSDPWEDHGTILKIMSAKNRLTKDVIRRHL